MSMEITHNPLLTHTFLISEGVLSHIVLNSEIVGLCSWCESRKEPVVSAVLVDFECHEVMSAEHDRGKDRATMEGGYAHALFVVAV
jgi:hypothetical protein